MDSEDQQLTLVLRVNPSIKMEASEVLEDSEDLHPVLGLSLNHSNRWVKFYLYLPLPRRPNITILSRIKTFFLIMTPRGFFSSAANLRHKSFNFLKTL